MRTQVYLRMFFYPNNNYHDLSQGCHAYMVATRFETLQITFRIRSNILVVFNALSGGSLLEDDTFFLAVQNDPIPHVHLPY